MLALLAASTIQAAIITIPPGLSAGDTYRLVFVTSMVRDATSPDISVYNDFVTTVAESIPELHALNATWKAIASTAAVNARDNAGASAAPIFRLDGTLIAAGTADLWDSFILNPISITETGTVITANGWTGSRADGTATADSLGNPFLVRTGFSDGTNRFWIAAGSLPPGNLNHLYGISSDLVVPSLIPEPASFVLMPAGLALLIGIRRYCRR
jgi:hypothetical protein